MDTDDDVAPGIDLTPLFLGFRGRVFEPLIVDPIWKPTRAPEPNDVEHDVGNKVPDSPGQFRDELSLPIEFPTTDSEEPRKSHGEPSRVQACTLVSPKTVFSPDEGHRRLAESLAPGIDLERANSGESFDGPFGWMWMRVRKAQVALVISLESPSNLIRQPVVPFPPVSEAHPDRPDLCDSIGNHPSQAVRCENDEVELTIVIDVSLSVEKLQQRMSVHQVEAIQQERTNDLPILDRRDLQRLRYSFAIGPREEKAEPLSVLPDPANPSGVLFEQLRVAQSESGREISEKLLSTALARKLRQDAHSRNDPVLRHETSLAIGALAIDFGYGMQSKHDGSQSHTRNPWIMSDSRRTESACSGSRESSRAQLEEFGHRRSSSRLVDVSRRPASSGLGSYLFHQGDTVDAEMMPIGPKEFLLPYREPFEWREILDFLRPRCLAGIEEVDRDRYRRIVRARGMPGLIEVRDEPAEQSLLLSVSFPQPEGLVEIVDRLRRVFDLRADPVSIREWLESDEMLSSALGGRPVPRIVMAWTGFEAAVRAILGQAVSLAAARSRANRVVAHLGERIETKGSSSLDRVFPTPEAVAVCESVPGLSEVTIRPLRDLARAICDGSIVLDCSADLADVRARLQEILRIGPWTAEYVALRGLGDPDAFPSSDLGLMRVSGMRAKELAAAAEKWRPWRGYAAMSLWRAFAEKR